MSLLQRKLKQGVEHRPLTILIHGENGEGKSTLAASAPGALVIDANKGAGEIGVDRVEPDSFGDVVDILREVAAGGTGYQTVVLDTLDELERLLESFIKDRDGLSASDYVDYKKGDKLAVSHAHTLWAEIERVRGAGVNVIILAYSELQRMREADAGEEVSQWGLRASVLGDFFRSHCDNVWFLRRQKFAQATDKKGFRKKAHYTGKTILYTQPSALAKAKDRIGLPAEIEIPLNGWPTLQAAIDEARRVIGPEELEALFERIPESDRETARQWLGTQKDKQRAIRLMLARLEQKEEETNE